MFELMLSDTQFRLGVFIGVLLLMATLETVGPRRRRTENRKSRWLTNISLALINAVILSLLGPITAVLVANYAHNNDWGLLNIVAIDLPLALQITLGVLLLDCAIYLQHVASHKVPFLWRFHKIHHADRDIDVTTGIRFHPIESILSMIYKCFVILILGPLPVAVFLFEVILNASAMFNHANFRLPLSIDRMLRRVIITPDIHRIHHSTIQKETDSNYGFFLSIWDQLFKTYIHQPRDGHENMNIGLNQYQLKKTSELKWSLLEPFRLK